MRRLLTGYAVNFNRRHKRIGHLFQNRYKSILCQEDAYFLELVRYIHLNPVRAGIVSGIVELDVYPFSGHAVIMGKKEDTWQNTKSVLESFDQAKTNARRRYREFVIKAIADGRRSELAGGGLVRSSGGWEAVRTARQERCHVKSDERILGDSGFVESVLQSAKEDFERKYRLKRQGYDIEMLAARVSELTGVAPEDIFLPGKKQLRVKARSLFSYWAVRELGYTMTDLAGRLKVTQPAVSISVERGEQLVKKEGYALLEPENVIIL